MVSVGSDTPSDTRKTAIEPVVTSREISSSLVSPQLEGQYPEPPAYHVFSRSRKLQMVCIVSLAAIFSPLSSNIYFPALGDVSRALDISMTLATLTITVYMIVQGTAPTLWGSISDVTGRRPVFIGTFVVYMIANVALAMSKNYGELMAFRALQAAGSAATISNGFGCMLGSYLIGYLMDYNHRLTEREYCEKQGYPAGTRVNLKSHSDISN
ncbi:uncharacterized protein ACLA_009450 [Aspergillus clavatus NRRL 1]|uniref:Major facilitator superfamily (MFS) profile domain-containing protein n=1 Tax=Aspergillus clavatus (strain ATCC 1007 / CBS 513.65 / DSM 816 / NCTC 3887 / NRRL 1 / QM 1276 / 107) TaxID=344612 RepID=A1C9V4_ASPCL|nr:uncharacterized protein ACLA_009450 [Aspergillus clavatus NRRL 1]EAW12522.1 hypothetical protein ACLA_009450 [Aspergillus clavatus NRRL 1]